MRCREALVALVYALAWPCSLGGRWTSSGQEWESPRETGILPSQEAHLELPWPSCLSGGQDGRSRLDADNQVMETGLEGETMEGLFHGTAPATDGLYNNVSVLILTMHEIRDKARAPGTACLITAKTHTRDPPTLLPWHLAPHPVVWRTGRTWVIRRHHLHTRN